MSLGVGIFLIAAGAILTYALNFEVSWIDLDTVGYILMAAGLVIVIIGIALIVRKRHSVVETRSGVDPVEDRRYTATDRRDDVAP
jgi:hypothetical protein